MGDAEKPIRLESWKEIASYLDVDVRTAQRYEERDGLPVHRDRRGKRGAVTAFSVEIDTWVRARHEAGIGNGLELEPLPGSTRQPVTAVTVGPALEHPAGEAGRGRAWVRAGGLVGVLLATLLGGYLVWRLPEVEGARISAGVPFVPQAGRYFARAAAEGGAMKSLPFEGRVGFVAFHPTGRELYVAGPDRSRLWVVSTGTWKVEHQVTMGPQPGRIRFAQDGDRAFVATSETEVVVVDTRTRQVVQSIDLSGIQMRDFEVTPDGQTVFVASPREGLLRYDLARKQSTLIPGLVCPSSLWLDPEARLLYVGSRCGGPDGTKGHDAIEIVEVATGKSLGAVSGPPMVAGHLIGSPSGTSFWIDGLDACRSEFYDRRGCPFVPGQVFHLFRTTDRRFIKTMGWPGGNNDRPPAPHPDGQRVVFLHGDEDFVEVVNVSTFRTMEKVSVLGASYAAISPDGRHLVIARKDPPSAVVLEATPGPLQMLPGLVGNYWPGDGTFDDAGNYWHLDVEGTVSFGPGVAGLAFRFDGSGRLRRGSPRFAADSGPKTVAAWVKPDAWTGEAPLLGEPATDAGWRTFLDSRGRLTLVAETRTELRLASTTRFQAGEWHHFALMRTGGELRMYVDGKLETAAPLPGEIPPGSGLVIGGDRAGKSLFRGLLDEILIHGDALPEKAIEGLSRRERM